jgi:hypothetical protein
MAVEALLMLLILLLLLKEVARVAVVVVVVVVEVVSFPTPLLVVGITAVVAVEKNDIMTGLDWIFTMSFLCVVIAVTDTHPNTHKEKCQQSQWKWNLKNSFFLSNIQTQAHRCFSSSFSSSFFFFFFLLLLLH